MRVDAHHHVWDLSVRSQDWLNEPIMAPIRRTFSLQELEEQLPQAGVTSTVVVQTSPSAAETLDLLDLAGSSSTISGVVGWLDLEDADVRPQMEAYLEHPHSEALVGIRDMAQGKPDKDWLARPEVLANLRRVGAAGMSYDLLTVPSQLPAAITAVRSCPETTFVVDHLSKPDIRGERIERWASDTRRLSESPNVSMKLSGMVTEADWESWTPDTLRPYVDVALEAFGPDRLLFGSDWPVCLLAATYEEVVRALESLVAHLTPDERRLIWGDTARSVYGLTR
jgi:L-fuconolactonase